MNEHKEIVRLLNEINSSLNNNYEWITGLISTLIGVFAGAFITNYFQFKGRLKIYKLDLIFLFLKDYDMMDQGSRIIQLENSPKEGELQVSIDFVNNKLVNEIIRDIYLEINHVQFELLDSNTISREHHFTHFDLLKNANFPAKSITSYNLKVILTEVTINLIKQKPKIYFSYLNSKNKKIKVLIDDLSKSQINTFK